MVFQRQDIPNLRFHDPSCESRRRHLILNGIHGILYLLQHSLICGRQIFRDHLLQLFRIQLDAAVKHSDDCQDRCNEGDNDAKHNAEDRFQHLGIGEQGNRYFFQRRSYCRAHSTFLLPQSKRRGQPYPRLLPILMCELPAAHRPPAFPNNAALYSGAIT